MRSSLALVTAGLALAACATDDGAPSLDDHALTAQAGSGAPPGGGTSPDSPPPTTTAPGGSQDEPHIPTDLKGASLTLAYEGHAHYTLPAWSSLPRVEVVDQLMIASFEQPSDTGPVTIQNATIFLHVTGDPVVDTYVFNFGPGVPNDPSSFADPDGYWYRRVGGAPSQAGPPMTGRPEIIMAAASRTTWTSLDEWTIPTLYTAHGWPSSTTARANTLAGAISLHVIAGGIALFWGESAVGLRVGSPPCTTVTKACGLSVVAVSAAFVAAYDSFQIYLSGNETLQKIGMAVGGTTGAGGLLAVWKTELGRKLLPAMARSYAICSGASATCTAEAGYYCGLATTVPANVALCDANTKLAGINWGGIVAMAFFATSAAVDTGLTLLFHSFGYGIG